MNRFMKTGILVLLAAAGLAGCQKKNQPGVIEPVTLKDVTYESEEQKWEAYRNMLDENTISKTFMDGMEAFSYETASRLLKERKSNLNYSPVSLYYALAMAGSGTEGETWAEVSDLLGTPDTDELAKQCGNLYRTLFYRQKYYDIMESYQGDQKDEKQPEISLGNSMWADKGIEIKTDYQSTLTDEFYASIHRVSFEEAQTWRDMEQWIKEHTKGILEPSLTENKETMVALINTLYYYGTWKDKFSSENTKEGTFTLADGSTVDVDFMNMEQYNYPYRKGEGYQTSSIVTGNGARMVFVLPDEDHTVDEFLDSPEALREAFGEADESREVIWRVPKFSFGSSMELAGLMRDLGINLMFSGQADFGKMTDQNLFVSNVIQETHIGVDEKGVEGAAYTMLMMEAAALHEPLEKVEMNLDRPFLYGIYDNYAGWLFIGVVDDPSGL